MSGVEPIALVNVSLELWRHGQLLVTQPAARLPFAVFNDSNDADGANDANDADGADGAAAAALTPTAAPMLGGTLLHFAAARLPPGLTAVGGFLNCSCRFDISATRWDWRAAHTAADALITTPASLSGGDGSGGLQCVSPRVELTAGQMLFGEGCSLPLLLSLNGQQYAPQPTPLHVYPPPVLAFTSPACGPVNGGTAVAVIGDKLRGGSAYRCRFGGLAVEATYESTRQGDLLHCSPTPPASAALNLSSAEIARQIGGSLAAPFAISLNGQQFVSAAAQPTFAFYNEPPLAALVEPLGGRPGTVVTVFGGGLGGGCAHRCRFGRETNATAEGTYEAARGKLTCAAPTSLPSGALSGALSGPISISLNGQQYGPTGFNFSSVD